LDPGAVEIGRSTKFPDTGSGDGQITSCSGGEPIEYAGWAFNQTEWEAQERLMYS